ncbi:ATP-binding protein [Grimontia sp. SpTr1]|uniref:HD domain-containing protein n=1 Tax=Grimontia sp. SpTr1 TaxID=2995319 RepID=UPI00248AAC38|nr:ATP-binding protein [Grimontia sp. SpTr1]
MSKEMYSDSKIFRASFGEKGDQYDAHRANLYDSLDTFRERVGELVSTLPEEVPGLTVHNLSHMDALWEMLDILVDEDYPLNPAEAYVLGGAILLHDSAMTIYAYRDGVDELKQTPEYRDALDYFKVNTSLDKDSVDFSKASEKYARSSALRMKHAEKAQDLATQGWRNPSNGEILHLIEDTQYREHFAHSIGLIAHSHNWGINELKTRLSETKGAFTDFPTEWTVNELKLGLILRCIDAMHIDDRRAPSFTSSIRHINSESLVHWSFQNKLAKPTISPENPKLIYSSKSPFNVDQAPAWSLCFDIIQMIDKELISCSDFMEERGIPHFKVSGVVGAQSPESLAKHIQVNGWTPLPLNMQVSDVPSLAKTLGGKDLYNYPLTPLRELIQNAADAIEARAAMEDEFNLQEHGEILIKINRNQDKTIIEVIDNGIGMSEKVLTGSLLDFGCSFWKSSAARTEFPGLQEFTHKFRGRYGIGFFSVFMWSSNIVVSSRRYQDGKGDFRALVFHDGMNSRPIMRPAEPSETSSRWNSMVRLEVNSNEFEDTILNQPRRPNNNGTVNYHRTHSPKDLPTLLKQMCGTLPVKVILKEDNKEPYSISLPNWKTCSNKEFVEFYKGALFSNSIVGDRFLETLSCITENGKVRGRAFISPYVDESNNNLFVYEKGIFINGLNFNNVCGVVESCTTNAARDRLPRAKYLTDEWFKDISKKCFDVCRNIGEQISIQSILARSGNTDDDQPQYIMGRKIISFNEAKELISERGTFNVILNCPGKGRNKLSWPRVNELHDIIGLQVDEERIHSVIGLRYGDSYLTSVDLVSDDIDTSIMNFISNDSSYLSKTLRKLSECCGEDYVVSCEYIKVDKSYEDDKLVIKVSS